MADLSILLGRSDQPVQLLARYGNRHGLIAGATGTGKTVSLMSIAEGFSRIGVPSFVADVKGDLAGLSRPGTLSPRILERVQHIGIEGFQPTASPVVFWDLEGQGGHPVRASVSELGPLLLSRMLALNEVQEGVINVAFHLADREGLLLLDLDDLRTLLSHIGSNAREISNQYGQVSSASIGAIQRALLVLEKQGASAFFGEPALQLEDFMRQDLSGHGLINVLRADHLILKPRLYSTFLLWMLSELFENLPELGDSEKPKLVFFFDEAHLLFKDAPRLLVDRIEQVVRLIRSKGVGVYFITQSPTDLPDIVLGQLGNRIQHALRAYTPREQKAVRVAADTFVANPAFDTAEVITQLGVGEALVSTLGDKGVPGMVQRTLMSPPRCRLGTIEDQERAESLARSPFAGKYDQTINRISAHEVLTQRAEQQVAAAAEVAAQQPVPTPAPARRAASTRTREGAGEAFLKSAARAIGSQMGRQLLRGVLGSVFKRK